MLYLFVNDKLYFAEIPCTGHAFYDYLPEVCNCEQCYKMSILEAGQSLCTIVMMHNHSLDKCLKCILIFNCQYRFDRNLVKNCRIFFEN